MVKVEGSLINFEKLNHLDEDINQILKERILGCQDEDLLTQYFHAIRPMYISFSLMLLENSHTFEDHPKTIFTAQNLPDEFFIDEFHKASIQSALNEILSLEDVIKLFKFTKAIHDNVVYKLRHIVRPVLDAMEFARIKSFKVPKDLDEELFLLIFEHRRYSQIYRYNNNYDVYSQDERLLDSYSYYPSNGYFEWLTN